MKTLFLILITLALSLAGAGMLLLLPPKKGDGRNQLQAGPVSPDSMIRVRPAGPGKLRMSFPQGDRMPLEVMLQIAEAKEDTDLDRLKDPSFDAKEKQEVVNRLRSMGYEIAYVPLSVGRPEINDKKEKDEEAGNPSLGREEPTSASVSGDDGRDTSQLSGQSTTDDRYASFLNDSGAIPPEGYEVVRETSDEDELLREIAEEEGLGAVQLLEPDVPVEDGSDGAKAIALMEFLSDGLRKGTVRPWVARYAEELLNMQVRNAPWRDGSRQSPRSEDEFKPLDPAILKMGLDRFDLPVLEKADWPDIQESHDTERRPVTVADLQRGGPHDLAWDRLDLE